MLKITGPCLFNTPEDMRQCGVVKNLDNCPYHSMDECIADKRNTQKWVGKVLESGRIMLQKFRFKLASIPLPHEDDVNLCKDCHILWIDIPTGCPVCREG